MAAGAHDQLLRQAGIAAADAAGWHVPELNDNDYGEPDPESMSTTVSPARRGRDSIGGADQVTGAGPGVEYSR
jgi:hypothetical protein